MEGKGGEGIRGKGRGPTPKGMVGELLLREGRGLLLRAPHYRYWPPYSLNPGYGPASVALRMTRWKPACRVSVNVGRTESNTDQFTVVSENRHPNTLGKLQYYHTEYNQKIGIMTTILFLLHNRQTP